MGFNLQGGYFNCWRCGRIKTLEAVMGLARVSRDKALELLRRHGDGRPGGKVAPRARKRSTVVPPAGLGPLKAVHVQYLEDRGLNLSIVEEWKLQGTGGLSDPGWTWRLVAPICDELGETVAYVGRALGDIKPKYRLTLDEHCAQDPRGLLYGIHKVPGDDVIVVEGPAGVWNLGPGAVATLGIAWRLEQANRLRRFKRRFILYDPEPKAQARALALAEHLSLYGGETELITGYKQDSGAMSRVQVRKLRRTLLGGK